MAQRQFNDLDLDLGYYKGVAKMIAERLKGKKFDIVSFHSSHNIDSRVWENCTLKTSVPIVVGTTVKIALNPRRFIAFDLNENPLVTVESERQIKIVREMARGDTLTKIILINDN
jgi:hypothetical protein